MTSFKWIQLILFLFAIGGWNGCAANAPKDTPCERKCGNRPISGGKLRAIPLTNEFSLECYTPGTRDSLGVFEYSFLLFEDKTPTVAAPQQSNPPVGAPTPDRIPIGGVAFYPSIIGLTSTYFTSPDGKGTETPSSDWCTDSCGIATIKVSPVCAKQEMSVGIIIPGITGESGALYTNPNPSVKLSISIPD